MTRLQHAFRRQCGQLLLARVNLRIAATLLTACLAVLGCNGTPAPAAPADSSGDVPADQSEVDTAGSSDAAPLDAAPDSAADTDAASEATSPDALLWACPKVFPGDVPTTTQPCGVALSCSYVEEHCCGEDYFMDCSCEVGKPLNCSVGDYCGSVAPCSPGCAKNQFTTDSGCQDCSDIVKGIQADLAVALAAAATCASPSDCVEAPYSLCGHDCVAALPKLAVAALKPAAVGVAATWCPDHGKEWPVYMNCWFNCYANQTKAPMACLSGRCAKASVCPLGSSLPGDSCDDQDLCTQGDQCIGPGTCSGKPKNCDDGDPCTLDTCAEGVCGHAKDLACELKACTPAGQLLWTADLVELPSAATLLGGDLGLAGPTPQRLSPLGAVSPLPQAQGWPKAKLRIGFGGAVTALETAYTPAPGGVAMTWTACAAADLSLAPSCTVGSTTVAYPPSVWSTDLFKGHVIALVNWPIIGDQFTGLLDTSSTGEFLPLPTKQQVSNFKQLAAVGGTDVAVLAQTNGGAWLLSHVYAGVTQTAEQPNGIFSCPMAILLADGGAAGQCIEKAGLNSAIVRWLPSGVVAWTGSWPAAPAPPTLQFDAGALIVWGPLKSGELRVVRHPLDGSAQQEWLLPKGIFELVSPAAVHFVWGDLLVYGKVPGSASKVLALRWAAKCPGAGPP